MRYGHGTCTILQHSFQAVKKFSTLKCKRHGKSTVPETSSKVYGSWRIYMHMWNRVIVSTAEEDQYLNTIGGTCFQVLPHLKNFQLPSFIPPLPPFFKYYCCCHLAALVSSGWLSEDLCTC